MSGGRFGAMTPAGPPVRLQENPIVRRLLLSLVLLLPAPLAGQQPSVDSFRLGIGDAIRIEIPDRPDLAGTFEIAHDGAVLLPLLGFVEVASRSFGEVVDEIETGYRVETADEPLRVTPLIRVMVQGQVRRPGYVTVDPADRFGAVLDRAGGLSETADPKRIRLVREGEVLATLDPETRPADVRFRPGDRLIVEERSWFRRHASAFIQAFGSIAAAALAGLIFG